MARKTKPQTSRSGPGWGGAREGAKPSPVPRSLWILGWVLFGLFFGFFTVGYALTFYER